MPGAERVCWEIPSNLPFVFADDHALVSIFFHLIDNANKYAPGGAITVRAEADSQQMRIRVTDQGPGILPEAQSLLFGKFYRLHRGDSQTVYGHGLGLYIARKQGIAVAEAELAQEVWGTLPGRRYHHGQAVHLAATPESRGRPGQPAPDPDAARFWVPPGDRAVREGRGLVEQAHLWYYFP